MNATFPTHDATAAAESYTNGIALALIAVWLAGLAAVIRQTKAGAPWTMLSEFTRLPKSDWDPVPNVVFSLTETNRLPPGLRNRIPSGFNAANMEVRHYPSGKCAFRISLPDGYYYFGQRTAEQFAAPSE